jgi:hypothetical protein
VIQAVSPPPPPPQVLDLLRTLRKDNTGYDLKQLFIGAEGTLGESAPSRPLHKYQRYCDKM